MAALDELLHTVALPYHHKLLLPAYTKHHIAVLEVSATQLAANLATYSGRC